MASAEAEINEILPPERSDVEQQLVFVPSSLSEDSLEFANSVIGSRRVNFASTSVRGATLMSSQGDHATAYALYWEDMRVTTAAYVRQEEPHVTPLVTDIYSRVEQDIQALLLCGLLQEPATILKEIESLERQIHGIVLTKHPRLTRPNYSDEESTRINEMIDKCQGWLNTYIKKECSAADYEGLNEKFRELVLARDLITHFDKSKDRFKRLKDRILLLKDNLNDNILSLKEEQRLQQDIISIASSLEDTPSSEQQSFSPERSNSAKINELLFKIQALKPFADKISDKIRSLKEEYFRTMLRELAQEFLLYQNQMPYVTFQRIDGLAASADEGSKVAASMDTLRKLNDSNVEEAELTNNMEQILNHAKIMLFIPRIDDQRLPSLQQFRKEILTNPRKNLLGCIFIRDNNLNVFSYIIARHLQTTFNAFPRLFENMNFRNRFKKEFINQMFDDWKISRAKHQEYITKIEQILAIYVEDLDLSRDFSLIGSPSRPTDELRERGNMHMSPSSPFGISASGVLSPYSGAGVGYTTDASGLETKGAASAPRLPREMLDSYGAAVAQGQPLSQMAASSSDKPLDTTAHNKGKEKSKGDKP